MIRPDPPVNTMRASGKRRASSATAVIRSAASLSATSPRAGDTTVSSAPPSTMKPVGAPREASQGGKRCFERQDDRIAERREADERDAGSTPATASRRPARAEARRHQDDAEEAEC